MGNPPAAESRAAPPTTAKPWTLHLAGIELDLDGYQVHAAGVPVHMSLKELQLLRALMENAGRVLTRRALLDQVWGSGYRDSNKTLDVHIRRLRRKLQIHPDAPAPIRTVRGLGYIFDLPRP